MGRLARDLEPFLRSITGDIWSFCRALNFTPTWQQAELLALVQAERRMKPSKRKKRIAVKSGQGPGKTTATVVAALWLVFLEEDSLVIVTAPTMRQCKDVWIAEARRLLTNANPVISKCVRIMGTRIEVGGKKNWGIWTVTSTKPENAQGYHQKNLTFIVDEASGVERSIIEQIKGTLSNENALLIMIGNPNTQDCAFHDCFSKDRARWHTLTWNAKDTERIKSHPDREGIAFRNKVLEIEFGKDHDVYRIRVLGEFPHTDPKCIIPLDALEACVANAMIDAARRTNVLRLNKAFGYDFARFGGDENVVYRRSGLAVVEAKTFAHVEPIALVRHAFKMQHHASWRDNECWHIADAGGLGGGVMHVFHEAHKQIFEFNNGSNASDSMYANRITEAWFNFARLAKLRLPHIPNDNRLVQQLSTRQYFTDKKGRIIIESKDEYMKRGHDSPDRADALVLAFYDECVAEGRTEAVGRVGTRVGTSMRRSR